jgi:GDP-L-fucose synthase
MYPRNLPHAMKEAEILSGSLEITNEGYALAKIVGWKTVQMMSVAHNWRTLVLSNLYGPGDHFESGRSHLIAAIIDKVAKAKELKLDSLEMWGDGTARREFTYVEDIALFIRNSMRQLQDFPDTLNLGSGIDYSVRDYYELVSEAMSYRGTIVPNLLKPTGMERKLMDVSKARALGWAPTTSIEDGIVETIKWYESNSMKGYR